MFAFKIFLLVFSSSGILAHQYGASKAETKGGLNLGIGLGLEGSGHDANSQTNGLPGIGAHVKANVDIAGMHLGYDEGVDLGGSKGIALTKQVDVAGHKVGVEQNEINLGQKTGNQPGQGIDGQGGGHSSTLQGDLSGKTEGAVILTTDGSQRTQTKSQNTKGLPNLGDILLGSGINTGSQDHGATNTNQDGVFKAISGIFGKDKQEGQRGDADTHTGKPTNLGLDGVKSIDLTKTVNGIFGIDNQESHTGSGNIHRTTGIEGKATNIDTNQLHTNSYGLDSYGGSSGTTRGNSNGKNLDIGHQYNSLGQHTQGSGSYSGSSSHSWSNSERLHSHKSGSSKDSSLHFGNRPFFDDHSAEDSEIITSGTGHSTKTVIHDHGRDHSHASGNSRGNSLHFGNRPFFDDHSAEDSEVIVSGSSHSSKSTTHDQGRGHSHVSSNSRGSVVHFGNRPFFDDHSAEDSEIITSGSAHSTKTIIHDHGRDHSHASGNSRGNSLHFGNRPFHDDHSAEDSEMIGVGTSHRSNNHRHDISTGHGVGLNSAISGKQETGESYGTGHSSGGHVHKIINVIEVERNHRDYGSHHSSSGEYVHRITDGINIDRDHRGHGSGHSSVVESGHTGGLGLGLAGSHRSGGSHESGGEYSHGIGLGIGIGSNHRDVDDFGSSSGTGSHGQGVDGHVVVGGYGTGPSDRGAGAGIGLGIGIKGGQHTSSGYGHSSYSG
ncbi:unnamed protein product [Diabrotica balteata]|uniref:Filaggrin-2-like n=1 Tax=Diabrotica balteata TaxID=107213 RepID=A0A9N9XB40_DIABA|nr:unnamed protein product [Diabrotica balteata]